MSWNMGALVFCIIRILLYFVSYKAVLLGKMCVCVNYLRGTWSRGHTHADADGARAANVAAQAVGEGP